ncbi:MAG: DUF1489 domain-containing protein [Rhodospirillales bacterium]|nr:DUF1489 domain-containing protein [Alphaproteobacteria bacterium]USO03810.1 MAG: DUF1489 domain-containing protein [Rhodospirillales bacterium]
MIKLAVGVETLADFALRHEAEATDYDGVLAVPCWTRFRARRAEEILSGGGSLYRVIKNRIQCRMKILGFEMVETADKGTRCMILQSPDIIQTVSVARRPFQGWRYLEEKDVPPDRGLYIRGQEAEDIPPEMEADLRESGLL